MSGAELSIKGKFTAIIKISFVNIVNVGTPVSPKENEENESCDLLRKNLALQSSGAPQKEKMFSSVFGHKEIKTELTKLLPSLSGSYLFHGPPSVGKRTMAFETARYALCVAGGADDCKCKSCSRFGIDHPDFLCIGQIDRIRVEDAERLLEFVSLKPFLSNRRVVVIDNADTATWEAANRLLKTIEEPPEGFLFFLISSRPEAVIATLRSRSFSIAFGQLSQEDIINIVWKKLGFELPQAKVIGWLAGSSVDVFSNAGVYVKHRDNAIEFISTLSRSDPLSPLDFVDKIDRKEIPIFVDMLMAILTDLLLLRNGITEIANVDILDDLTKIASRMSPKSLLAVTNTASQVKKYAHLNVNLSMVMKSAAIRMHAMAGAGETV